MCISVLNKMVVVVLRYFDSVRSFWPKTHASIPGVTNFWPSDPLPPPPPTKLSINLDATNFHRTENSRGSIYSPNLVFLGAPGANRQGVYQTPWTAALWKRAWPGQG